VKLFKSSAATVKLIGGRLCLDFVNTVGGRKSDSPHRKSQTLNTLVRDDKLGDYSDLVSWSRHSRIITATEVGRLIQKSKRSAIEGQTVFERALALREALYRIFKARLTGRTPPRVNLETLNDELLEARSHERLIHGADGFTWTWSGTGVALDRILWPVAHSAAEFLTTGDLSRLRECGGDDCGWLFEDTSRNRSRQWCHMQDCGNVAKVRRFRMRLLRNRKS